MTVMYGIKNCDTIKKARKFLEDNHIDYQFHDYRQQGISIELLHRFSEQLDWSLLLNKATQNPVSTMIIFTF